MATLKVFNPVARPLAQRMDRASRVRGLSGKRIGLYWNMKIGGDVALQRVEELLRERYPDAGFASYQGNVGFAMRHVTGSEVDRIARECDVMIGTTGD